MGATAATVPKLITWAPVGKSVSSVSPFGAKIEVAMRLAGIDYTVAAGDPTNSKTFVKQKVLSGDSTCHFQPMRGSAWRCYNTSGHTGPVISHPQNAWFIAWDPFRNAMLGVSLVQHPNNQPLLLNMPTTIASCTR